MHKAKRIAVIGQQDSGKTTLVEAMLQYWTSQGLHVGVIKHDGHVRADDADDWEKANADTTRFSQAGARVTLLTGGGRSLMRMAKDADAMDVLALCHRLETVAQGQGQPLDVIVVEGYKQSSLDKLVVARRVEDVQWLHEHARNLGSLLGVVCPEALRHLVEFDMQVYDDRQIPTLCTELLGRL